MNSIVADIEQAEVDDVVVVGHSLAGIIAPAVAEIGRRRVRELILAAAVVPRVAKREETNDGIADGFRPPIVATRSEVGRTKRPFLWVRYGYLNGVPRARRRFVKGKLYTESGSILDRGYFQR